MSTWDLTTAQKLLFLVTLIAGAISAGYAARRAGVGERFARAAMYFVVIVPYTLVGMLAIWRLKFHVEFVALPIFGFTVMMAGLASGAIFARLLKLPRQSAGAFVLTAGASNLGFTMGGFVNYTLFGEQGLAVAAMYTMFWNFGMVLVLYPIARHYGQGERQPLWKLILANFVDIRALPLLSVTTGLALNLSGVAQPGFVDRLHVIDIGIIGGAIIAFFVTGLRLHFEHFRMRAPLYPIVAGIKFVLMPAVGALLVGLMILIGHPLPHPGGPVVLVQASTPSAIYAVVISSLFRLDDRLASIVFVINTATYLLIVLPLVVWLLS